MTPKYCKETGFVQRDSVERQGYAKAPSTGNREDKERGGANEKLALAGYHDFPAQYERLHNLH